MLSSQTFIPIPPARPTEFDHGAWHEPSDRVFVAHTAEDAVEVIDARARRHETTLPGHAEAAGVVVGGDLVAVTNRGAASVSLLDAATLDAVATYPTGTRPNGVALAPRRGFVLVACVGADDAPPVLDRIELRDGRRETMQLPGRPRWCVIDRAEERLFCAIREPSLILVVDLAGFMETARWPLPSAGAHGLDLDEAGDRLFVACDGAELVAVSLQSGAVIGGWPLPGVPDATFVNPATGRVHVAVGNPGVVVSVDPRDDAQVVFATEAGAKTTALAAPDRLFVFLPRRGGALELIDRPD